MIKKKYDEIFRQRTFSLSHQFGAVKFVRQSYVTKTEVYLYDDESEEVCIDDY